jgi:hypothetical protein
MNWLLEADEYKPIRLSAQTPLEPRDRFAFESMRGSPASQDS